MPLLIQHNFVALHLTFINLYKIYGIAKPINSCLYSCEQEAYFFYKAQTIHSEINFCTHRTYNYLLSRKKQNEFLAYHFLYINVQFTLKSLHKVTF